MRKVVATGKTIEEAVMSALVRLGVPRSQAQVRVIREPARGFLGWLSGREAEVEVTVIETPLDAAKEFLRTAISKMGLGQAVIVADDVDEEGHVKLSISADEDALPILIGRRGATLDALQYLVNIVANRDASEKMRFTLDAAGYRDRRLESLRRLADEAADKAVRLGRPVALDPMPRKDRKWVHAHLQSRGDVVTVSEGQEPYRRVKIIPKRHDWIE
ncbi:RNA-binding cell elongation regulator Jag/EloR [Alicyclobacillus acidocaldarius]|uniref:RNA-binding protein KhpB n=2 Tax=Alicyclobacillus acidocaldarius TaxID=405212 RepID=C8WVB2_ALIAD|nr:RNA-binding cell elongation regulator Jag/EloR [Alicyclobacillus acidocaldarius]ACV59949.1 single-stranded nucleic acid binding R3H domain protein [Alicyclobacillus acidocaldarius subsp. acidocaldarius DSM 446]